MNDWTLKLPSRIRPALEEIAREEFVPVPDLVRQLVQKAILARQLERSKKQQQQPTK
jgi:hypothetical protein